jgi:hypothetical protein
MTARQRLRWVASLNALAAFLALLAGYVLAYLVGPH